MASYGAEDVPGSWDDKRDTAFFRITASLFSTEFTFGAGVLLASYDEDCEAPTRAVDAPTARTNSPLLIG